MHRHALLLVAFGMLLFDAGLVVSPVPWVALCVAGAVAVLVGMFGLDVKKKP